MKTYLSVAFRLARHRADQDSGLTSSRLFFAVAVVLTLSLVAACTPVAQAPGSTATAAPTPLAQATPGTQATATRATTAPTASPTMRPAATATLVATPTATATATPVVARPDWAAIVAVLDGNIVLVSADGKRQQRLTDDGGYATPRSSPDGLRIAYVRGDGLQAEVGTVNVDGTGRRALTANAVADLGPVWSPDGKTLAFTRSGDTNQDGRVDIRDEAEVWLMDGGGGNQRRLAAGRDPAWAPDGVRLAFAANGNAIDSPPYRVDNAINLINSKGENEWSLVRVSDTPAQVTLGGSRFGTNTTLLKSPTWRPDGSTIAFTTNGHTGLVMTVSARGGDLRMIDANYEGGFGRIVWSPAGDRIAYEAYPPIGINEIVVFDPVGQRLGTIGGMRGGLSAAEPDWSPDGKVLAFAQQEAEPFLGVADSDGANPKSILQGRVRWPDWLRKK